MKKTDRQAICAVITALTLMITGAWYPAPRVGWWCTAFAVVCDEATQPEPADQGQIVFKWKVAELWDAWFA